MYMYISMSMCVMMPDLYVAGTWQLVHAGDSFCIVFSITAVPSFASSRSNLI